MTTDDRLVSGVPSLNPNKSSGDIVERLAPVKRKLSQQPMYVGAHNDANAWMDEAAAEIERLRRELADAKLVLTDPAAFHLHALRNNVLSRMNALHIACATDYDSLKARALTAESAVAAAWEEAAKIAETFFFNDIGKLQVGPSIQDGIASAIRAAGSKKTAESGHSPSTHNSESE